MLLYKILSTSLWEARGGEVPPAPIDEQDGFIHLSTGAQLRETAEKHFANRTELTLIVVDSDALEADSLRWEVSRGGDLFPHVYGALPLSAVIETSELVGDQAGAFEFPADIVGTTA